MADISSGGTEAMNVITFVRKEEEIKEIDCGESVTTRYYDAEGKIVRQDIEIRVTKGLNIGSEVKWP